MEEVWDHVESSESWRPSHSELSGEKGLGQGGDKELNSHSDSSRVLLWRWENLPEGQPSPQHSTNQAFMVEGPDGSHSSVKTLDSPLGVCQKALKDSDHEKQDSLV